MGSEWTTARLGDMCTKIGSGATPRGGEAVYREDGIPLIRSQNVLQGRFTSDGLARIGEEHARELDNVTVLTGDVLLNITGASVARVCQVPCELVPARVNQHVAIVRADAEQLVPRYLHYVLNSPSMQALLWSLASSGATRQALTKQMIEDLRIDLPPLPEQRAIAHILGTLDDKIENNRRTAATLEAMARALYKAWFVDFEPVRAKMAGRPSASAPGDLAALFPARLVDSALGEIPEGWRVGTVGSMCELAYGKALKASDRRAGPVPVMGSRGQTGWHDAALVKGPGVVVGRKGNPGAVTWVARDFFPIDTTFYVVLKQRRVPLEYLYYALEDVELSRLSADSAVPGLNRDAAYSALVLRPPAALLEMFVELSCTCLEGISAVVAEGETMATIRDALLPKLVSGEVALS